MSDLQFAILVLLLLWLIHRIPSRWQQDVRLKWIHDQLNEINASARGIPFSRVEEECRNYLSNRSAESLTRRFFW
jgi:hypothetical protein